MTILCKFTLILYSNRRYPNISFDSVNFRWENTLKWTGAILKLISINYIFSFYLNKIKLLYGQRYFILMDIFLIRMLGSNRELISLYFQD